MRSTRAREGHLFKRDLLLLRATLASELISVDGIKQLRRHELSIVGVYYSWGWQVHCTECMY